MAQVNKYDNSHILSNITQLAKSVMDVAIRRRSLETSKEVETYKADKAYAGTKYSADQHLKGVEESNKTQKEIAELRRELDRELEYYRGNINLMLKDMGIRGDQILEIMKHLNLKDRMEFENSLMKELENLKHTNALDQIQKTFENNLLLHEFDADEAMRRTITQAMGSIMTRAINSLSGASKTAMFQAMQMLEDGIYNNWQRNWNNKMLAKYGNIVKGDKTLYNFGGKVNVEENKPGWEGRHELQGSQEPGSKYWSHPKEGFKKAQGGKLY